MREFKKHVRILGALMMREVVTRYGREGLGFLWVIGEPLVFCFGVIGLWSLLKPEYEHGIRLAPFVMTGYMSLLLFRHTVSMSLGALQANLGLLHHRIVRPLHVYLARGLLELGGGAMAFIIVYLVLLALGLVNPPRDVLKIYGGYLLMGWLATGFGLLMAALTIRFEVIERVVPVSMYLLIPLSGAFVMVDWLPPAYQGLYLLNPLPHAIEMVRSGVFGEFVPTHYNPFYPLTFGAILGLAGLLMLASSQRHLEVE